MKRIALISFPLALVIAAACQEGVVNPTDDDSLVPGPRFAKWTDHNGVVGCSATTLFVKFQLTGKGLRVTGTSGVDNVDCSGSGLDITFSGGDGNDIFVGGSYSRKGGVLPTAIRFEIPVITEVEFAGPVNLSSV